MLNSKLLGASSSDNSTFYVYTYGAGIDKITLTPYHLKTGSLGAKTINCPASTGTIGSIQPVFSADGKYMATSVISGSNYGVAIFDASAGINGVTYLNKFFVTGATSIGSISISPRGKYISCTVSGSVNPYHVYDCTSSYSSPTKIADWTTSSFTSFSPRGLTFTPSGNIGTSASSDEGYCVLIPSLTQYFHNWTGFNQAFRGYSYNGDTHLYFGTAVYASNTPYTWKFAYNGTSGTSIGIGTSSSYLRPTSVCPIAGYPHIAGWTYISDPGSDSFTTNPAVQAAAGKLHIRDFSTNSTVLISTYNSNTATPLYLLNGDLVHYNATAAATKVLRPSTSYGDVTSEYSAATLSVVTDNDFAGLTPNTNCWPVYGKQTVYSSI